MVVLRFHLTKTRAAISSPIVTTQAHCAPPMTSMTFSLSHAHGPAMHPSYRERNLPGTPPDTPFTRLTNITHSRRISKGLELKWLRREHQRLGPKPVKQRSGVNDWHNPRFLLVNPCPCRPLILSHHLEPRFPHKFAQAEHVGGLLVTK